MVASLAVVEQLTELREELKMCQLMNLENAQTCDEFRRESANLIMT
jgi:hypothetical protein